MRSLLLALVDGFLLEYSLPLCWPPNCASATKLIPPSILPMGIKYNLCSLWTHIVTLSAVLHHNFSFKFIQLHVMRKTTIWGRVKRGCGVAQSHWLLTVVRWGKSMEVLYTYRGLLSALWVVGWRNGFGPLSKLRGSQGAVTEDYF